MTTRKKPSRTADRDNKGRFAEGNSGRPKGAKGKFTALKDEFIDVYQKEGGRDALKALMAERPDVYFGLFRDLFPKEIRQAVTAHTTVEHIGMSESEALAVEVTNAIPIKAQIDG